MSESLPPAAFACLEPDARDWTLGEAAARNTARRSSTLPELRNFDDALLQPVVSITDYLHTMPPVSPAHAEQQLPDLTTTFTAINRAVWQRRFGMRSPADAGESVSPEVSRQALPDLLGEGLSTVDATQRGLTTGAAREMFLSNQRSPSVTRTKRWAIWFTAGPPFSDINQHQGAVNEN